MLKMIIQDIGSKSELSTRKYKPMIVLDDEESADWVNFIFSSLLDNVKRYHTMKKKSPEESNGVYFKPVEKKMPVVD